MYVKYILFFQNCRAFNSHFQNSYDIAYQNRLRLCVLCVSLRNSICGQRDSDHLGMPASCPISFDGLLCRILHGTVTYYQDGKQSIASRKHVFSILSCLTDSVEEESKTKLLTKMSQATFSSVLSLLQFDCFCEA